MEGVSWVYREAFAGVMCAEETLLWVTHSFYEEVST